MAEQTMAMAVVTPEPTSLTTPVTSLATVTSETSPVIVFNEWLDLPTHRQNVYSPKYDNLKVSSFQLERLVAKGELMYLRPWNDKIPFYPVWVNEDELKQKKTLLFIHEVYCLYKWRRRDRHLGAKQVDMPDYVNYYEDYYPYIAVAQRWIDRERKKVEAFKDGEKKTEYLEAIVFHEEWIQQIAAKWAEVAAAEAEEKRAEERVDNGAEGVEDEAMEDAEEGTKETYEDARENAMEE